MKKWMMALLWLAVATTAVSCRYEEGPFLSFKTPEERIVGYWKLADVYKNETKVDSTDVWPNQPGSYYAFFIERVISVTALYGSVMDESTYGSWEFQNKNKDLYIFFKSKRGNKYEYVAEIKRLTPDELVYEFYDEQNDKWRFEFDSRSSQYY